MAMGYMFEGAEGFVTEHFRMYPRPARIIWDTEEGEQDAGEVLEGQGRGELWSGADLKPALEHIIRHCDAAGSMFRFGSCCLQIGLH